MTIVKTVSLQTSNIFCGLYIGVAICIVIIFIVCISCDEFLYKNKKWFVPLTIIVSVLISVICCKCFLPSQQYEIICDDDITVNELITTYNVVNVDGMVITVKEKKK